MKHIPNILTSLRILIIPFFIWKMLEGDLFWAGVLLLLSGVTDLLDGLLARSFHWVSDIGKVLDPIADKLTQGAISITMLVKLYAYWPFFVIFLVKDFVMLVLGGYLLKKGVRLEGARWFGKLATFMFYGTMILILFFPNMSTVVTLILLTISVACALGAGLMYIPQFISYKNSIPKEEEKEKEKEHRKTAS